MTMKMRIINFFGFYFSAKMTAFNPEELPQATGHQNSRDIFEMLFKQRLPTLYTTILLKEPGFIESVEGLFQLPVTGNFKKLMSNYRKEYWTYDTLGSYPIPSFLDSRDIPRSYSLKRCFQLAARSGFLDVIEYYEEKFPRFVDYEDGMIYAALGGHKDLVEYFVAKGDEVPIDI